MKKQHSRKFKQNLPKKKTLYKRPHKKKKEKIKKSPRNYRIIPEISFNSLRPIFWNKYFLVSFISTFISVAIIMQGVDLTQHVRQLQSIRSERQQVLREVAHWEGIVAAYQDYRDGYFKLSLLEYRLGNKKKARYYIDKALGVDPNYQPALEFKNKIERGG